MAVSLQSVSGCLQLRRAVRCRGVPHSSRCTRHSARLDLPNSLVFLQRIRSASRKTKAAVYSASTGLEGMGTGLAPELRAALEKFVQENKVVLFMKGTKQFPQCGFSNTCVQIFNVLGATFESVNVLEDESLRQGIKEFSQWPTIPQVYINGEFFGGCDIMIEAYQSGELAETLEAALNS